MTSASEPSSLPDADTYDVIVVGGGPGGEASAAHLARAGARVAMVERELVGGECPYWGCMPSKALLRAPQALAETLRVPGAAEAVTGPLDVAALLARRDDVIRNLDDSSHAERITKHGVELVRGHGRLAGSHRVHVTLNDGSERHLAATKAVILAPGTRAAMPPIDGLVEAKPWTNREATVTERIPATLAVLGGGVIGVELAQAFAALGSDVTIVEGGDRLLAREEPQASQLVHDSLDRMGVDVRCGAKVKRVSRDVAADGADAGAVHLHLDGGGEVVADELLVAVGRQGNTEALGLETVGVEADKRGNVEVLDCMHHEQHPWLFVVGDANGRAQLTHAAAYQARVAARNALGLETHCVDDHVAAPRVTFTEPAVAAVGHTLASAEEAGLRAKAFDRDPQRLAAASFHGRGTDGFARLVVDMDSGCIVGATFAASDISELLHSATIAIVGGVPIERLRHCVAPFPTRSEVWTRLVELLDRDPELMHR